MLSFQAFAAIPDVEANSLIRCTEGTTVSEAVSELNGAVASSALRTATGDGAYYHIENYTSSQPIITKLDNGKISVCVTLTRKK